MTFTERRGIVPRSADICVRNDAPKELRRFVFQLMRHFEPSLKRIRRLVCDVTYNGEDPNNWQENDFMKYEISDIIENCEWNRIYDIIEQFYCQVSPLSQNDFEKKVNEYFLMNGIGWKMEKGIIEARGDKAFEDGIEKAKFKLEEKGLNTSQNEIKEAISDLSRRPSPEITGSIQHALAALECVCREVTGNRKATLGELLNDNPQIVPRPLDEAIKKVWGFSSEKGRHLKEGNEPSYEEAELVVHLVASLCVYLASKFKSTDYPI